MFKPKQKLEVDIKAHVTDLSWPTFVSTFIAFCAPLDFNFTNEDWIMHQCIENPMYAAVKVWANFIEIINANIGLNNTNTLANQL